MTRICIVSTSIIRPSASKTHHEFSPKIELTPCDLQLLQADAIQKGLLFHQIPKTNNFIKHLKDTLSQTLAIFYPLAGRLAMSVNNDDKTTTFNIDCNGQGAQFFHAVAENVTVADIISPDVVPSDVVYSFFALNGLLNFQGTSHPLLVVQVTELADGIFIGCTVNHCVADGSSFWHFFNTWAEISRDESGNASTTMQSSLPSFCRKFIENMDVRLPIHLPFFLDETIRVSPKSPLQQRVFHFSKAKIAQLKAKANLDMRTTNKISSLQALMAHLWVSITRNRSLEPEEEVSYGILIGLRPRTQPPLPEHYFGNAVLIGTVKSTAGELISRGPSWAGMEMNRMIVCQTKEEVDKFITNWADNIEMKTVGGLPCNLLITGSSPRFDIYGNDFGWGKPAAVRSGAGNKSDGKLTVFAGVEEGSVDFEACLSPETLMALARDEEFMSLLS